MKSFVLPLSDSQATLENVGGKGMSLAKMINAGLPIPDGFHITTEAYRTFISDNDLQTKILAALSAVDTSLPTSLETTSATIGRLFADGKIPANLAAAITNAYIELSNRQSKIENRKSAAIRSSATAEDLPEASFAGQQETYLNIHGIDEVLDAVKKCWASLWTARAIAYRIKNNINQNTVALAVVVQEMVNAEASGILFTVNPMNGHRDEMVINAAWGLGEAIVGGLVSPDTIVAEKATGKVKKVDIAEKTVITVLTESGTREEALNDARRRSQVLKEAEVVELVGIARRIESFYGKPQDIEWCHRDGRFYIVQSRPITALPEPPIEWIPPNPKGQYMRASVVDLMPEPLSPLFVTMGIPAQVAQMQPLAQRLTGANPVLHDDYYTSINNYAYMNAAFPLKSWWWILTSLIPMFFKTFGKLGLFWRDQLHPEYRAFVASKRNKVPEQMSVDELWHEAQELVNASSYYVCGLLYATMGASSGAELLATSAYNKMAKREGDPDAATLLMGWDNIPVRAEKSLYDLAMWAQAHDELAKHLLETPTAELTAKYAKSAKENKIKKLGELGDSENMWDEFVSRFQPHLDQFGHIIFQLDFAAPLPLDDPAPMLENIKMYLRGEGTNPYERQKASEEKRIKTGEIMMRRLKGFKRWAFTKALNYGQSMAAVREDALAEIGLGYPMLRRILHELGSRFVEAGVIEQPSDVFLLEKNEIEALVSGAQLKLSSLVTERKAFWDRLRKETPPPMMPMKKRVMGVSSEVFIAQSADAQASNVLKGAATSAGKVTAPACILHGPEDFHKMRHGDVLVAGTTTPAWTPLFAMASAVVTDIGGPLSHGSIVAREYGIPAVMGTGIATKRIQSGQVITVDGTKGEVILETTKEDQTERPAPPIEWPLPRPKLMMARGSLAEHLPNPVSPLFGTLGLRSVNKATLTLGDLMGGMDLLAAEYQYRVINGYVFFGFLMSAKFMWTMIKVTFTSLNLMYTQSKERWLEAREIFANAITPWEQKQVENLSPSELLEGVRDLMYAAGKYYTVIQSSTLPSASSSELIFTGIYKMVSRKDEPKAETLLFGLDTVPLRAEKSLFDLGMWIRERPVLRDFTLHASRPTEELVAALQADSHPEMIPAQEWDEFKSRLEKHADEFGHTSFEFDFTNPTPAETPELILDSIKMYVEGKGSDPYARQREVMERREQTLQKIRSRFKLIPNRWFNKVLKWAMDTAPAREDSLADMGMGHTAIRRMLGELGKRFVANGALENPDDIYWLVEDEVNELASMLERSEKLPDYSGKVPARKAEWREQMKLVPPAILPEKSGWAKLIPWARKNEAGNLLKGLGASSGKVTAKACVMFAPEDFSRMKPGDVLVAVITTPAWTPLFTMASAIVTDIGGPLSHSSIVAREYGIPAVLATGNGTRRIRDGQTITVDGSVGTVELN